MLKKQKVRIYWPPAKLAAEEKAAELADGGEWCDDDTHEFVANIMEEAKKKKAKLWFPGTVVAVEGSMCHVVYDDKKISGVGVEGVRKWEIRKYVRLRAET